MSAGSAAVPDGEQAAQAVGGGDGALLEELAGDHADRQAGGDGDGIRAADEAGGVGLGRGPAVVLGDHVEAEPAVRQQLQAAVGEGCQGV